MATSDTPVLLSASQLAARSFALGLLLALITAIVLTKAWKLIDPNRDEDATVERIRPTAYLDLRPPAVAAPRGKRTGLAVVQESCQSCHGQGLDGAPKIGDRKAWASRRKKDMNALLQSVATGKGCMLPGAASVAEEEELARAIVYMIWPSMRL